MSQGTDRYTAHREMWAAAVTRLAAEAAVWRNPDGSTSYVGLTNSDVAEIAKTADMLTEAYVKKFY